MDKPVYLRMYDATIEQQIRNRAYEIWQYRMEFDDTIMVDKHGYERELTAQDDWLLAEKEIMGKLK